ncbi:septum formation initiator [Bifidobacterium callitrichos DSM 23973]|uniref:Septum formation initiator n=1 Tax=Bifidobacterium callitrichos DSM 23973 TaxID=1437609 RepID=A0A087A9W1_9BIFI|nr:septum formation initiator [Bifidobacterium callitrichos DSM 23973]
MSTRNRSTPKDGKASNVKKRQRSGNFGPIAFFVSLFIVAVGAIQLVSTFNTYATDLAHLNSLKREEAALIAQKQELENNISRWNDKNYVAAQARERLGFVFPGEQSVLVQHPEAVTGDDAAEDGTSGESASTGTDTSKQLLGTVNWHMRSRRPTSRMTKAIRTTIRPMASWTAASRRRPRTTRTRRDSKQ